MWKIRKKQITKLDGIPTLMEIKTNLTDACCYFLFILMMIMLPGRRADEEGGEDNGLEEDSGDGQVCTAAFEAT